MHKTYIKPAKEGLIVRQPNNGQPLPADGAWVHWTSYWHRRLNDGAIRKAQPPKKTKPATQAKANTKEND